MPTGPLPSLLARLPSRAQHRGIFRSLIVLFQTNTTRVRILLAWLICELQRTSNAERFAEFSTARATPRFVSGGAATVCRERRNSDRGSDRIWIAEGCRTFDGSCRSALLTVVPQRIAAAPAIAKCDDSQQSCNCFDGG